MNNVENIYTKIAKLYDELFSEPSFGINSFVRLMPRGAKVLDLGCGPGRDALFLSNKGFKVNGIDLSPKMIELAKERCPNCSFETCDITKADFSKNTYDGVFAAWVLHHIEKKTVPQVIKKVYSALIPGGIVFLGIQEGKSIESFIPEPFLPSQKIFVNIMSEQKVIDLLELNKFKVLKRISRAAAQKEEFNFRKLVIIAKK